MPPQVSDQPAKKQSKWSPEEDTLIIELRGRGMKWEDISKQLPGRSAISCRLHYQNYLERRSEWSEERKDKLAQLYERFKADMWAKVAEELAVPWRAAEAMHWQLGETDMARRAGVVPFSLAAVNAEANANARRNSPSRGHYAHPHAGMHGDTGAPNRSLYGRSPQTVSGRPRAHTVGSRREPLTPQPRPMVEEQPEMGYGQVPMLAPIQSQAFPAKGRSLPSISELTTGITPYSGAPGPAQGIGIPNSMPLPHSSFVPAGPGYAAHEPLGSKRPASPDPNIRDAHHRRRIG
ncbi:unnamed protein product [Clonostachys solani]|uniref:Uncharacterized protein n=1 Tax=Clonostachys solani TaxID=160281 RepID=A0A9N9ZQ26_9HYPO|nr:unnamed protein product [Clonostachys solani]